MSWTSHHPPFCFIHEGRPKAGAKLAMTEVRTAMIRFITSLALALAGLVLFGQGAYIHAKALLAQVLLERAFSETIASGREVKPWSWADTWPVARIEVKRLHASAIVLAGSSGQALAFGPGHVELTPDAGERGDRKSTRLNSSHPSISYAV